MGNFNPDLFQKTFAFVNDIQKAERQKIDKAIETEKDPRRREDLKKMSQRMVSVIDILLKLMFFPFVEVYGGE